MFAFQFAVSIALAFLYRLALGSLGVLAFAIVATLLGGL